MSLTLSALLSLSIKVKGNSDVLLYLDKHILCSFEATVAKHAGCMLWSEQYQHPEHKPVPGQPGQVPE